MSSAIHDRDARATRAGNEKIAEVTDEFGEISKIEIVCECSDQSYTRLLQIRTEAYVSVLRNANLFVVLADHVRWEVERVVSRESAYAVVELTG